MSYDINCPYCDAKLEINHDDGYGYEENTLHEMDCGQCEKTLTFTTEISFSYEAHKADCLNDGEHLYKLNKHFPRRCSRMECITCDHSRPLTEFEMQNLKLQEGEKWED